MWAPQWWIEPWPRDGTKSTRTISSRLKNTLSIHEGSRSCGEYASVPLKPLYLRVRTHASDSLELLQPAVILWHRFVWFGSDVGRANDDWQKFLAQGNFEV
ncbi:MAG TPA: hypothetical protein DHW22_06005 [Planctomycetaceae bacterium]|nr:hypothetical protein [Planctomycetaceae bacterium]